MDRPKGAQAAERIAAILVVVLGLTGSALAEDPSGVRDPIHGYETLPAHDRFSRFKADLDAGRVKLDAGDERALLRSVLRTLDVPVSSQMIVTSATSFQKTIISPRRPRALYFNDDTYVGYVPRGQIEVISIDPTRGPMFYIFNRLEAGKVPRSRRSENCLTCHGTPEMGEVPQLVIESVIPGLSGGGERAFRRGLSGHGVPLDQRFGGWLVTDAPEFTHQGNMLIDWKDGRAQELPMQPGELFDFGRYPVSTSGLLPQLLHEHQVGFINRAVSATYRARTLLHRNGGDEAAVAPQLDTLARDLVRYILFADEVPLPPGGVTASDDFRADFLARRRPTSDGRSLRDLDLKTRLLTHRCSYMIESAAFEGLPPPLRRAVDRELARALDSKSPAPDYAYLPDDEKAAIRSILAETKLSLRTD
ncbi:hypothetical protein [Paludisphaera rhizosphaerae]|uniref:hypothetical protein n=1 Tax=Paludisphaera rhizosphaerae TaxID=2711216 RepID=UPI0013EB545F|nr:hypothetical protein [Paludisphaera rhizosphaerae]